jgi:hypothetical protein
VRDSLEKEASAKQAFVDILDNGIIKPLTTFMEKTNDKIKQIEEDLKKSAAEYADHAEKNISKLQAAYFKKYYPRRSRCQQDNSKETELAKSEVSDNDFRSAVNVLNHFRLKRAEHLGDGYDCLEAYVFAPIINTIIMKYMDGMVSVP